MIVKNENNQKGLHTCSPFFLFLQVMIPPHWKRVTPAAVCLGVLLLGCSRPQTQTLEERVGRFWDAQIAHDRVTAQQLVSPDSRNNFLRSPERIYRSWKIDKVTLRSEEEAAVQVSYEGFVEGIRRFHRLGETQIWKKVDGEWFLTLGPASQVLEESLKKVYTPKQPQVDGRIVVGEEVKIPFFNQSQIGALTIRNGTREAVRLAEVDLDPDLFEIVEKPDVIPGPGRAQIKIRHLGPDRLKNQTSPMRVVVVCKDEAEEYMVQVHYNYISPGLRGLLGLTTQEAAELKRTDKVRPKMHVPLPEEQAERLQGLQNRIEQKRPNN